MNRRELIIKADVSMKWEGKPPSYRIYVNDEMFTERTWVWKEEYLEEMLQIAAPPGEYKLRWEMVPPATGKITVKNLRIEQRPFMLGQIFAIPGVNVTKNTLRIANASI
jgi:hypothetical protein